MAWIETREGKRGKLYYVYDRDREGKKTKPIPCGHSKALAIQTRNNVELGATRERNNLPELDLTVSEVAQRYITAKKNIKTLAPKTIHAIEYAAQKLSKHLGDLPIAEVTSQDLTRFKDALLVSHSVNGFKDIFRVVQAIFGFAVLRGMVRDNPAKGVDDLKEVKVGRFLNDIEVSLIMAAFDPGTDLTRNIQKSRAGMLNFIKVALYMFMRKNEILLVRPEQISDGRVYMDREQIKTRKNKSVPIHPECEEIFADKKNWFNDGWSVNRINRMWVRGMRRVRQIAKENKLPDPGRIRFHDLKHTACSKYLQRGGTLTELSNMTGNDYESLSGVYAHFEKRDHDKKIALVQYNFGANLGAEKEKTGNIRQQQANEQLSA